MKLISWNVNGLRACLGKGFTDAFEAMNADFFCLQETKLQAGQVTLDLPGYHQFWNYAEKKGYSGTAIFAKKEPLSVRLGLGVPELDTEGAAINGKEGLMQTVTVMPFVDKGDAVMAVEPVNRVESYA